VCAFTQQNNFAEAKRGGVGHVERRNAAFAAILLSVEFRREKHDGKSSSSVVYDFTGGAPSVWVTHRGAYPHVLFEAKWV
jgi:hypothetical protein